MVKRRARISFLVASHLTRERATLPCESSDSMAHVERRGHAACTKPHADREVKAEGLCSRDCGRTELPARGVVW